MINIGIIRKKIEWKENKENEMIEIMIVEVWKKKKFMEMIIMEGMKMVK